MLSEPPPPLIVNPPLVLPLMVSFLIEPVILVVPLPVALIVQPLVPVAAAKLTLKPLVLMVAALAAFDVLAVAVQESAKVETADAPKAILTMSAPPLPKSVIVSMPEILKVSMPAPPVKVA